jgi:hypothetical protein
VLVVTSPVGNATKPATGGYRYLTERERALWSTAVAVARRIAELLWQNPHQRDVQAIATTLYTHSVRTGLDVKSVTEIGRVYLECARFAAATMEDATTDTVRRAAATLFIYHLSPDGTANDDEQPEPAVPEPAGAARSHASRRSAASDVEVLDLDI